MVSYKTIVRILRDIAARHVADEWKRLNSFSAIHHKEEFSLSNFGRNRDDFEFGTFWVRKGVTLDSNCVDYGALFIQNQSSYRNGDQKCYNYLIGVAFPEKCDKCPNKQDLSREMLDTMCEDVLDGVINELKSYKLFDTPDGKIWATDKQIDCLGIQVNMVCDQLKFHIQNERIEIRLSRNIGSSKLHIADANISICGCVIDEQEFVDCYDDEDCPTGMVQCDSCF